MAAKHNEDRKASLAQMHSHSNRLEFIKPEDILKKFLIAKPRRLFNGGKSCYFVFQIFHILNDSKF